ncbi:hypothetical protein [Paucibacter soli]|uniref:hypothetical protein n=1 Tax=Paucibacter soli TaxID=3133433 RepID=UPI0030A38B5D
MLSKADFEREIASSLANGQSLKSWVHILISSKEEWSSEALVGLLKGDYFPSPGMRRYCDLSGFEIQALNKPAPAGRKARP